MVEIDITIDAEAEWQSEEDLRRLAATVVAAICRQLSWANCRSELSLFFTSDEKIRALNASWRNKDKATNVLSFPSKVMAIGDKPGPLLGDIVIARQTVEREARAEGKKFEDHLSHLIVHGFLHLIGFDHETEEDAVKMEELERLILRSIAICDPYLVSTEGHTS